MKKTMHAILASRAKRKRAAKAVVMQQKTAAGILYLVRYPTPKKHKGYQPNVASQLGAPASGTCGPA